MLRDFNSKPTVQDRKLDILTITETWLSESTSYNASHLCPSDFSIFRSDRAHGPGGGVAILCRDFFKPTQIYFSKYTSFEYCAIQISAGPQIYHILAIYRPPQTTNAVFQAEFGSFIEETCIGNTPVILSGDLNIHYDDPTLPMTRSYLDILSSFGLLQHVQLPTHDKGHVLDHILTRECDNLNVRKVTIGDFISDHSMVICTLSVEKPKSERKHFKFRKLRDIDIPSFSADIQELDLLKSYNSINLPTLAGLLDKHAPL